MSPGEHKVVLEAIQHWLSKDPSFFVSTMEALNLNLQLGNIVNQYDKSVKHVHPLQAVWDQYRQLYYESIQEFVTELLEVERKNDDSEVDNKQDGSNGKGMRDGNIMMLGKLKAVGFGDPKWSQQYRQVRGYKINQDQLTRYMTRENIELGERQEALAKALKSIKSLEDNMGKKILSLSESKTTTPTTNSNAGFVAFMDPIYNANYNNRTKTHKKNARKPRKNGLRKENQQVEDKNNMPNKVEELSTYNNMPSVKSFFEQAWASISSSILGDSESRPCTSQPNRSIDTDVKENDVRTVRQGYDVCFTDKIGERANGNTGEYYEDYFIPSKSQRRDRNTVARLEKRIERKELAIKQLQRKINALTAKLRQIKRSKAKSKPPILMGEYEHAQIAVVEARDSICDEFAKHIKERHNTSIQQYQTLDAKTDLTKPYEWYPYARLDRRKIIFHGGPTNSGKTYSALQRLKEAKKGLYLGPLRLLAAEIYETLTAEGLYTNLFTGQERREIAFSTHTAATVEMCNVTKEYDIVVIDEIQMIADASRGAAWTKALMGLRCKEIHVCGGLEAMDIVKKIADACGDDFESNRYERFSDLKVSTSSLSRNPKKKGSYKNVQAGDCIVAFSRNDIFAIKREVESTTNYKCSVIYGKLPPQTRADQARRFNDPNSGYDILVASDAIGMGLNLNIKRIVFNSIFKFNGEKIIRLSHSEIKQISGRAGRHNSPFPNGEVSCRDYRDLGYIRECLSSEIEPLRKAALVPTEAHIELFAEAIHAYTFSNNLDDESDGRDSHGYPDLHEILRQFGVMATVKGDFFLGRQNEMATIAKRLKKIPIRLRDAYTMCLSPTTDNSLKLLESFATKVSQGEVFGLPSRPVPKKAKSFDDLSHLCNIYADVDLFMWLQYKFPPGNAVELATALARKEQTMEYINAALSITEQLKLNHCYLKMSNQHRSAWEMENGGPDNNSGMDNFVEGYVDDDDGLVFAGDDYDKRYDDDDDYDDNDDEYFIVEDKEAVY
jgi:ATP-dependent RNA helicase SUPV3L1/SUV3